MDNTTNLKRCSKCREEKELTEFNKDKKSKDGLSYWCKSCVIHNCKLHYRNKKGIYAQKRHERYLIHKEHDLYISRLYVNNNREAVLLQKRNYTQAHKNLPEFKKRKRDRRMYKRATDAAYKLKDILRDRLRSAIKHNTKTGSAVRDLGCSIDSLLQYLQDNYTGIIDSKTEIDHVIPAKFLDLSYYPHLRLFCNWRNLRYMDKCDNIQRDYSDIVGTPIMDLIWDV